MSSNFLDAGDMSRLDREATLTEQAPRQPIEEDRTPDEPESDIALLLRGLAMAFEGRF